VQFVGAAPEAPKGLHYRKGPLKMPAVPGDKVGLWLLAASLPSTASYSRALQHHRLAWSQMCPSTCVEAPDAVHAAFPATSLHVRVRNTAAMRCFLGMKLIMHGIALAGR